MTGPHPPLGPQPGDPDYSRYAPGTNERLVLRELEQNAGRLASRHDGRLLEALGGSDPKVASIYADVMAEVAAVPHPRKTDARDKHIAKASHAHVARMGDLETIRQQYGSYERARREVLRAHHALNKSGVAGNSPEARAKLRLLQSDAKAYADLKQQIEAMRASKVKSPNILVFGFLAIRHANEAKNRAVRAEVMTKILGMGYGGLVGEAVAEQRGYNGLTEINESGLRWLSVRFQDAFSAENDRRARENWISEHAERLARQGFKDSDDPANAPALAEATRRYAARLTHMVDDGTFGGRVKGRAKRIASYARGMAEDYVAPVDPDDEAAVAARAKAVVAETARHTAELTNMAREDVLDTDIRYDRWLSEYSEILAVAQFGYQNVGDPVYDALVQRYRALIDKMSGKGVLRTEGSAVQFGRALVDYEHLTQDTKDRKEEYKALQRTARSLVALMRAYYGTTAAPGTAVAYVGARLRSRNRILNPSRAELSRQRSRTISAVAFSGVLSAVAIL